jgi:hypothetical protein
MAFHCREMVVSLICRCPNRVKTHQVLGARCHFSAVEVEKNWMLIKKPEQVG